MLRDIPKIYLMFFAFAIVLMMFFVSYTNDFLRGGDTLTLNDIVLTSAVSKIDQMSRINKGTLILEDTFEMKAWEELGDKYPKGSDVEFDYVFDHENNNFTGVPKKKTSTTYTLGGTEVPSEDSAVFKDIPVKAIRLKVRKDGDNVTKGGSGWTYTSTVKLDVAND